MTRRDQADKPAPVPRRPRARTLIPKDRNASNRVLLMADVDASGRGVIVPADGFSRRKIKSRHFKRGQKFIGYIHGIRDEAQWAKAHRLGQLLCDHVEAFADCNGDAHEALKKLQVDGRIACKVSKVTIAGGLGVYEHVQPQSLAFGEMDQVVFDQVYPKLCREAKKYFPDAKDGIAKDGTFRTGEEAIDQMVRVMEDA